MLVLSRQDVEELLDLERLVDALAVAMADVSAGRASMPPRVATHVDSHQGMLLAMLAYLPTGDALTTKLVSLFPRNRDRPTHQALIVCFDPANGTSLALMDGTFITATRTAAGSALASRHLARPDAKVLTIVGTGVQARAHARAFASWSGIEAVVIAGRTADAVARLVDELVVLGLPAEAEESVAAAVSRGDIVCATTHAAHPVVRRSWVRPGTHVNSVGYNAAGEGEVDLDLIRDAFVVVETRQAALAPPPSGAVELRRAIDHGVESPVDAELGEIVSGAAAGRKAADAITLYKSVGIAVQDAATASLVLAEAKVRGRGIELDI